METENLKLKDTIEMMCSNDYKERFKAEYWQLKIRYERLVSFLKKWDAGELPFSPDCKRELYNIQICGMRQYLTILERRAEIENIDLTFKNSDTEDAYEMW